MREENSDQCGGTAATWTLCELARDIDLPPHPRNVGILFVLQANLCRGVCLHSVHDWQRGLPCATTRDAQA